LFVLQVALFRQAEEWGLQAESVAGYGPAVAYAAGTLCLDDACTLVASAESSLVHKEPVIPIVTNSSIETTTVLELGENCLHPRAFLATVAEAHVHGTAVQFRSLFARTGARRIDLPTYAFQRKRYWLEDGGWRGGASN
jgi:acyl transferase domain-containing protein